MKPLASLLSCSTALNRPRFSVPVQLGLALILGAVAIPLAFSQDGPPQRPHPRTGRP